MQRIDNRTVQLNPLELDIRHDTEDWDEDTDPHAFIYNRAAEYGGVVQEDFANYLAESMVLGANGFHIGMRWAGSTVTGMDVQTHAVYLTLANGTTTSVGR